MPVLSALPFVALALAADPVALRVQVKAPDLPAGDRIVLRTTWLGQEMSVALADDAATPTDRSADGVYSAALGGEAVRVLPIELVIEASDGSTTLLAAYDEPMELGADDLAYAVSFSPTVTVRRVAAAWSQRAAETADLAVTGAGLGWTGLVLAYVGWLVARRPDTP